MAAWSLRPRVIAPKVSFGFRSDAGARTREIFMTIILTLKQRFADLPTRFKRGLDQLARNPDLDPCNLLKQDPSHPAFIDETLRGRMFPPGRRIASLSLTVAASPTNTLAMHAVSLHNGSAVPNKRRETSVN